MSEMVDGAARAVEAAGYNPSTAAAITRIVIAALREPTNEMLKSAAAKWDDDWCTQTNALNMWQTMIDEALK